MKRFVVAFALTVFCAGSLVAQSSASGQNNGAQTNSPVIRSTTQQVTVDMVFRDKKGKAIHDIKPEEIHVLENGVEQHLDAFQYVANESAETNASAKPVAAAGSTPVDPLRELRLVTLVFENLDLEGKRFFRQALDDMLKVAPEQNLYFSVMVIDQKLNMIQSFTNDRAALMKTVEKSAMWDTPQYMRTSSEIKSQLRQTISQAEAGSQSTGTGQAAGPPSQNQIQQGVTLRMAKMQYDMLEQADAADRDTGARGTIESLLALIRSEAHLPGRKVVLYFNPSLFIPEIIKEQYHYMISAANQANISFYTVDPKGLITDSQGNQGRSQLSSATGEIYNQQMSKVIQTQGAPAPESADSGFVGAVTSSQARVDETAENGIRSNPLLWLRDLAQQTGGQAIGDTNDLKAPLRTVMDEVRSYYEASYDPHIANYDGQFRRISVRVDRPGIEVHTRSGYYALPQLKGGEQVVAYEVPLLNAVGAASAPTDLPLFIAAERFNGRGPKIEYMLTIESPLKDMSFTPQPDGKNALLDAPLLALVRNSSGDVVAKFSKEFAVQVPANSIEDYRKVDLIQTYRTELAPGTYTIEAAIMDKKGNKIGVKKTPLTVPDPNDKLAISDVIIVRRNDKVTDGQMTDPFYYPGGKVTPTLNTTLKGGPGNVLPFYFAVYPDPAIKDAPQLKMAFYKDGQYLGAAGAPLPPAQKDGRIPYIADLPADKFTPGSYEIRLAVTQGSDSAEQKVDFQVQ